MIMHQRQDGYSGSGRQRSGSVGNEVLDTAWKTKEPYIIVLQMLILQSIEDENEQYA